MNFTKAGPLVWGLPFCSVVALEATRRAYIAGSKLGPA